MSFLDSVVAQVLGLEVSFHHTHARLACRTDSEALHDLRISLRKLRSLLRPIRRLDVPRSLDEAAADVGRLTTPVRDLEVLIGELDRQGFHFQATRRRELVESSYSAIVESSTVRRFVAVLDEWPARMRQAERDGELEHLRDRVKTRLQRQANVLRRALADPAYDRHILRLLVKRMRYAHEAYPKVLVISSEAASALKKVQSALGDWHDHFQWCLKAEQEQDLLVLKDRWEIAAKAELEAAEVELLILAECLEELAPKARSSS
ncbi:CHAD domain-containing protein [Pseudomonas sp. BN102]|uniref:CHAD domain-containing protein n=1 Tax=Pseudomonas sp. BN102 TaxID=2567886 RepID=UPI002455420A|nr:CHAD domain-containing protein [Pseudomonas sp. BN102]MDH4612406.1 CHAD domain-containing protein [Pseudomonas sp. BN102]